MNNEIERLIENNARTLEQHILPDLLAQLGEHSAVLAETKPYLLHADNPEHLRVILEAADVIYPLQAMRQHNAQNQNTAPTTDTRGPDKKAPFFKPIAPLMGNSKQPLEQHGIYDGAFFIQYDSTGEMSSGAYTEGGNTCAAYIGGIPDQAIKEKMKRAQTLGGNLRFFQMNHLKGIDLMDVAAIATDHGVLKPAPEDYWRQADLMEDEATQISDAISRLTVDLAMQSDRTKDRLHGVFNELGHMLAKNSKWNGLTLRTALFTAVATQDWTPLVTVPTAIMAATNGAMLLNKLTYDGLAPLKHKASQMLYNKLPAYRERMDRLMQSSILKSVRAFYQEHKALPNPHELPLETQRETAIILQSIAPNATQKTLKDTLAAHIDHIGNEIGATRDIENEHQQANKSHLYFDSQPERR